ncbi:MAG: histidine kinase [Candidatus Sedimenticola sp. (ex Thyasira tokunagai)]
MIDDVKTDSKVKESPDSIAAMKGPSSALRLALAGHLLGPLGLLAASMVFNLVLVLLLLGGIVDEESFAALLLLTVLVSLSSLLVGVGRLRNQLLRPLAQLEQSVAGVSDGEPWSTLPLDHVGVLGPVTRDLDNLSGELIDLYDDMDNRVAWQTRRLSHQTSSLKILYDVAASINKFDDTDELLLRYLRVFKEMVRGIAATVQLTNPDGRVRLVGSLGANDHLLTEEQQLPIPLCQCGRTLSSGDLLCEHDAKACSARNGRRMYDTEEMERIDIPLEHHGDQLGLYRIYVKRPALKGREDLLDLLPTIGNHFGFAIAKQRSDEEALWLSIIQERTTLAHELHDSLAQTLASLRFQVRMLDETLELEKPYRHARDELERIRNGLDEAHTELRELLNSFRAPVDQRGLEPALEKLTERFSQETGIATYFQRSCRQINLDTSEEMQLLRIVQECLTNTRKHAQAHNVRVLLNCKQGGEYILLVEDDGVGFDNIQPHGFPGEHIGLSIMEERAHRLGANIKIESEPGEGTRVELVYSKGESSPQGSG